MIFRVIQWHWQWCHSIGHIWFPISVPLQLFLYVAPLLTRCYHLFPKRWKGHMTLNTYPFAGNIPCVHQYSWVSISTRNLKWPTCQIWSLYLYPLRRYDRWFIHCLWAGVQPALDPSGETFWIGPMRQPMEMRRVDRCVSCERYVGWRREIRLEQLERWYKMSKIGWFVVVRSHSRSLE